MVGNSKVLVFNRVAKVGSQAITRLLVELQQKNNFQVISIAPLDLKGNNDTNERYAKYWYLVNTN